MITATTNNSNELQTAFTNEQHYRISTTNKMSFTIKTMATKVILMYIPAKFDMATQLSSYR